MNNCTVLNDDEYKNNSGTCDGLGETDLIEYPAVRWLLATLHITAIVTSAVGNGLLLVYILHHRRRTRSTTATTLILNLAAVDFVSSAVNQPMRLVDMLSPHPNGFVDSEAFCRASGFVALFLACVGFHTIVAIGQERLLLICYPLTAKAWLTRRTTAKILLAIWAVAFCSALPFPIRFSHRLPICLPTAEYNFCTVNGSSGDLHYYYIFVFTVYYALPLVAVVACYGRVFASLTGTGASYGGCLADEAVAKLLRHRRSLAWMMAAVAASFAVFEGPFFCTFLYLSLGYRFHSNRVFVKMLIDFLPILSHVVNPAVYLVRAKTFRRSIAASGSETRISRVATRAVNRLVHQTLLVTTKSANGGPETQLHGYRCTDESSPYDRNQVLNVTTPDNSQTIRS